MRLVANCAHCGYVDSSRTYPPPNWRCFNCGKINDVIEVKHGKSRKQ